MKVWQFHISVHYQYERHYYRGSCNLSGAERLFEGTAPLIAIDTTSSMDAITPSFETWTLWSEGIYRQYGMLDDSETKQRYYEKYRLCPELPLSRLQALRMVLA